MGPFYVGSFFGSMVGFYSMLLSFDSIFGWLVELFTYTILEGPIVKVRKSGGRAMWPVVAGSCSSSGSSTNFASRPFVWVTSKGTSGGKWGSRKWKCLLANSAR